MEAVAAVELAVGVPAEEQEFEVVDDFQLKLLVVVE